MQNKPFRNIATVRNLEQANSLISCGIQLLFKHVDRIPGLHKEYCLLQDKQGHTVVLCFERFIDSYLREGYEVIVPWSPMDIESNQSGWGAYVLPLNLEVGELVFIPDLLENISGQSSFRKRNALAIWNGEDFEIQPEEEEHSVG
jgi:hypothetical protein